MFNAFAVMLSFCNFSKCLSGADSELKKIEVKRINNNNKLYDIMYDILEKNTFIFELI